MRPFVQVALRTDPDWVGGNKFESLGVEGIVLAHRETVVRGLADFHAAKPHRLARRPFPWGVPGATGDPEGNRRPFLAEEPEKSSPYAAAVHLGRGVHSGFA